MSFKTFLVYMILLLTPFVSNAETCWDIDDNFNIIEYECGKPQTKTKIQKQEIKVRPFIKLGYGTVLSESWFAEGLYLPSSISESNSFYGSAGISIKPNNKNFYDLEVSGSYTSNNYIKNYNILMDIYAGYYLVDSFAVYAGFGAGYGSSTAEYPYEGYIHPAVTKSYINLDSSGLALRLAGGLQYDITNWLGLFVEYTYTLQRTETEGEMVLQSNYVQLPSFHINDDEMRSSNLHNILIGLKATF